MSEDHSRQTIYSDALTKSLEIFVSFAEKAVGDVMSNGLRPIAEAASLDRIIFFRIFNLESNAAGEVYRWDKVKGGTAPIDDALVVLPITSALKRWISITNKDTCIALKKSEFAEDEAEFLSPRGVKSILIAPVFTERKLWGVVTFHDNTNERDFDEGCTSLLRSAARLGATTLMREEKTKEVDHANRLMRTINTMSIALLKSSIDSFESDLLGSMGIIAETANVDRVYVWKNFIKRGRLFCSQKYEWSVGASALEDNKVIKETSYSDIVPGWEGILSQGKCINGIVGKMSESEQAFLAPWKVRSILIEPVFLQNRFWGFVGFDDYRKERIFSENEELLLRSASQLIANALLLNEEAVIVREADERTKLMLDSMPMCCQIWDENLNVIDCNQAGLKLFGFKNKEEYLEKFFECYPEYQSDGQRSEEKAVMLVQKAFSEGYCFFEWTHQMPNGKPIPAEVTLVRIKYRNEFVVVWYARDLRSIKKMEKSIEWLEAEVDKIYYDPLTGIYNRRFLDENLNRLIKLLSHSESMLSMMMIDIDYFKNYNDTYGHINGDNCLRMIAETLMHMITRSDDFVARYGGEEFVVVLPNTDEKGARMVAERLIEAIQKRKITHGKSDVADCVTISIGVATGKVEHARNEHDFIRRADEMCYKSKQDGRNRYTFGEL